MKILFTAIIAFTIGIISHNLLQGCKSANVTIPCGQICTDYTKAGNFNYLNVDLLYNMAQKFKGTSGMINNSVAPNLIDARSVWFDLDSLKRFIWEIETDVCRNTCPEKLPLNLGVRVYYARYPPTGSLAQYDDIRHLPDDYENRHTVFMVPTFDVAGTPTQHIDFDPRYFDATGCHPERLQLKFPPEDSALRKASGIVALSAFNHGGMCPPICVPGDTYFGN
jgi:hypothetical protein